MKTYTDKEINIMTDEEAKNAYAELTAVYENLFGIEYVDASGLATIKEALHLLAGYVRENKPCPMTKEELLEYDY